jgi:exocyst complex protein 7
VYAAGKTFWDIDDWVKEQKDSLSPDGKVMQLCSWVVNYLKYVLALFPEALSKVLFIAGSWEGADEEEKGLARGITQILETLEAIVEARATEFQDPALRHIFLMNNMYYIRNRVKNSDLGPFLGEDLMSEVGRKVCTLHQNFQIAFKRFQHDVIDFSTCSAPAWFKVLSFVISMNFPNLLFKVKVNFVLD